jgi:[ribosomal protein S18]-alanine N-acetyltransferase
VRIRPAVSFDTPSILAIERACLTAAHWNEERYLELFRPEEDKPKRLVLVAESSLTVSLKDTVIGFLVARQVASEWELENIVVASDAHRHGIGRQLLEALLNTARKIDSASVSLEVRESNLAARALYEKLGFRQTGRRPAYYVNPSEDAILYRHDLPGNNLLENDLPKSDLPKK